MGCLITSLQYFEEPVSSKYFSSPCDSINIALITISYRNHDRPRLSIGRQGHRQCFHLDYEIYYLISNIMYLN